ncbi:MULTISPECIES: twin-arginine translocase subunit TatC [Gammaproteobacteria]|jgi:sec-independent protein translocase protein TatC|uniref:Sec-independent protein translocase protein TatC n=1 Tax=Vreelandella halophila TaxID=86177 RepID=A0A9X5B6A8_9GAMM|nr:MULTISPECIES: twin-arginine translocase subunit TatC [Gammaproteobacteria]KAA8983616.1 twin-arginine translocase subunit TatC [Halospina sp. K52047b]MYL27313.1 twin-arginine translocase subunit TatC [Halomonas utahensis]MYL75992.1 twin-arginine translocase subunit TatC [Halomonas sp. 22501_18_FS]
MSQQDDSLDENTMPLVAHLVELRNRLLKAILAILVIFLALYPFANQLYAWLSGPLRAYLPEGSSMIATDVAAPFFAPLKLTLVLGTFLAMPVVLYQIWRFMAPGLYRHEKRIAFPLLASSILLFYLGAVFAYYVVFPLVFAFFTSVGPAEVTVMTDMSSYLSFVLKLLFAFGIAFEIPIAIMLMILSGATDTQSLREKRPYVVVGCFVVGMLMTPPDMISQTLLAGPMWLLFEIGLIFGRMVERRRPPDDADAA